MLSDADNQSMVGRCKAQPEVPRSEIVNQSFFNARTSHSSYDDPDNPTPPISKIMRFVFQGEVCQCVVSYSETKRKTLAPSYAHLKQSACAAESL